MHEVHEHSFAQLNSSQLLVSIPLQRLVFYIRTDSVASHDALLEDSSLLASWTCSVDVDQSTSSVPEPSYLQAQEFSSQ